MTMMNEAVRLFFAMAALILVGFLSTPMSTQLSSNLANTKAGSHQELKKSSTQESTRKISVKKKTTGKKVAVIADKKKSKQRKS